MPLCADAFGPSDKAMTGAKIKHTQSRVFAVVVTHDRPALLNRCVQALANQNTPPAQILIVDNGSDPAVAHRADARILRLGSNLGPAAGYAAGIRAALAAGADHVWLMDDDAVPQTQDCLARLLRTQAIADSALTCPLVRDIADARRLAFPIRQRGRTRFAVADLEPGSVIDGFAHLFNGALISAAAFARIGMPNAELFMRGDEVDFLLRARRAGLRIVTDKAAGFLHPSCRAEIHPILAGAFYAMVPATPAKRWCQFRNRGWIFSRRGLWGWLAADHIRYACHYLGAARDPVGYARWLHATWSGVLGRLGSPDAAPGHGQTRLVERAS